ncbi:MAG TPA: DmsC/YnfH family molybdoenzyme membrane anchor subunit [Acidobacteriaceae bacterium]|nr:DmsC/YnfH family molybdoenzyme membrane anchor subunit [Acidobacteriaceae bacterium]
MNAFAPLEEDKVELPLLERSTESGEMFLLTTHRVPESAEPACSCVELPQQNLTPLRAPGPGEQYRFHFDMTKCIGCKCCVVACNEQNGNPADIQWRRVGDIEGGAYPQTMRNYLSMGCNHCVEPTCLVGCPVDAYVKDESTGIVLHNAERCIGCQYCTWNCSYGVPQYNPERGVVGKCDMCHSRLTEGDSPACVDACPEQAIRIEIVNIEQWRATYASAANAPGLPSADDSLSTTRITLPAELPEEVTKADAFRVRPEQPHWPLVVMTVLTQTSVAALASLLVEHLLRPAQALRTAAAGALLVVMIALSASTFHLGRPAYAWRALKMWRRSWLSREVLLFSLFAGCGALYSAALWADHRASDFLGAATVLFGVAGIFASARLYTVAARPAWNSGHTFVEFYLSGSLSGTLFAALFLPAARQQLDRAAAVAGACILLQQILKFAWLAGSRVFELRSAGALLWNVLRPPFLLRGAGLIILELVLIHGGPGSPIAVTVFLLSLAVEILGRWLFFVSVVPKNMASSYLHAQEAA